MLMNVAAFLALAAPEPMAAQLSAGQMLVVGQRLQQSGQNDQAMKIYEALDADPSPQVRAEALGRRASILMAKGRVRDAAVLVRRVVDMQPERTDARIALAQILDRIGDIEGARRQLRAAQAGHLPTELSRATARYADALRARAPNGWTVEFSLAPDSNINRATGSDTLTTVIGDFDLNADARPRSGVGVAIRASAFTRFRVSDAMQWAARVEGAQDRYREAAFNRTTLAVYTGPELSLGATRVNLDVGAGQSRIGGRAFQRWAQLAARGYRPLGTRTALGASLSAARVDNLANDLQDGRALSAAVSIDRALTPNIGLQAQLSASRFAARDPGYSTRALDVALGGWFDLGRVTLTASAGAGRLASDARLSLFPKVRRDRSTRFSVGASARTLRLLTFSPFVRLQAERNASTVEIWDYRRRRFEVGLQRAY